MTEEACGDRERPRGRRREPFFVRPMLDGHWAIETASAFYGEDVVCSVWDNEERARDVCRLTNERERRARRMNDG